MMSPVHIVVVGVTALLALELLLNAVSAAVGLSVWRQRMHEIPRLDLSRGAELIVALYSVLGLVLLVVGLRSTPALLAGAVLALAGAGTVLTRQLRYGDRGRALGSYLTFTGSSLLLLVLAVLP